MDQHQNLTRRGLLWPDHPNRDSEAPDGKEFHAPYASEGGYDLPDYAGAPVSIAHEKSVLTGVRSGMRDLLVELWAFMSERKKWWLFPIVMVLLILGTLIVLTQGSAVAPFVYTLF